MRQNHAIPTRGATGSVLVPCRRQQANQAPVVGADTVALLTGVALGREG
jgi:hypothetical protein